MRELVTYADPATTPVGEFPALVGSTLIFDSNGERRIADYAPVNWRDQSGALEALFARAKLPEPRVLRDG